MVDVDMRYVLESRESFKEEIQIPDCCREVREACQAKETAKVRHGVGSSDITRLELEGAVLKLAS